jgi:uncharacterized repeat protein (TIGR02543 family)
MLKAFNSFLLSFLLAAFSVVSISCSDSGGDSGGGSENPPSNYTVSFYDDNGAALTQYNRTVAVGTQINLPAPTKADHTFDGWRLNGIGSPLTGSYTVNANTTFVAKWTSTNPGVTEYTVSFYDNGVVLPEYSTSATSGSQITLPSPTKANHTFNGWLLNGIGSPLTDSYTVNANTVFVAKWAADTPTATYTVSFYDDGNPIPELGLTEVSGGQITLPVPPAKIGYTFNGWLLNGTGSPLTGTYTVNANTVFHAKWTEDVPNYTVSFYDNGNPIPELGITVGSGSQITLPPYTKLGHTLDGWLKNNTGSPINGTYTVTENVTFHTKFTVKTYTVSFYDNNGRKYDDIGEEATHGESIVLPSRVKTDYTFDGWLANKIGSPIKGAYTVTDNVSFYARFTLPGAAEITTAAELYNIRSNLSGKYILANNISLSEYNTGLGWEPIGTTSGSPFTGVLYGNGFKITDLYVDRNVAGLFGYIGNGAVISDLTVEVSLSGVKGKGYAGGLAGSVSGTVISNVHITGTSVIQAADNSTYAYSAYSGGIAGYLENSTLSDCSNTNNVSSSYSGGIAGRVVGTVTITNSYNIGDVSSYSSSGGVVYSGGIVGHLYSNNSTITSTITNSYNTGNISSYSSSYADSGGIAGHVLSEGTAAIQDCYNTGNISSSDGLRTGGIVGACDGGGALTITNNAAISAEIKVTGSSAHPGRIVGIRSGTGTSNNFALDSMQAVGSYFNNTLANHGISKTAEQLKVRSTYEDPAADAGLGWQFGNNDEHPWKMQADGYPILYWQADTSDIAVSFYDNGNPIPELGLTEESETQINLPVPTKTGYTFDGWLLNGVGTPLTGSYTVNVNTAFIAKWTIDDLSVTEYAVSFYENGIQIPQYSRKVPSGTQINLPISAKMGYTFDGWLLNGTGYSLKTTHTVNANAIFIAKWTPTNPNITEWTVSFYDNGVVLPEYSKVMASGTQITLPTPTKAGYTFNGWLLNGTGSLLTGTHTVNTNAVFIAKWTANNPSVTEWSISFYDNGVVLPGYSKAVADGTQINFSIPIKTGYTFNGWLLNGAGELLIDTYTVNANTIFIANWTTTNPGVTEYTVSFYDNGTVLPEYSKAVASGTQIILSAPTKAGYTFIGWLLNGTGELLTGTHTVNANAIFIAIWIPNNPSVTEYTVSFYDNGFVLPEFSRAVASGTQITLPAPVKTDYTFNGWLLNGTGELLDSAYTVSAHAVFIAKWTVNNPSITEYAVSFYDNGAVLPEFSRAVLGGTQITLPTPTKTGYTFDGWLLNGTGALLTNKYTVNTDTVFIAKWTSDNITEYAISFYDSGAVMPEHSTIVGSGTHITLPSLTKIGYAFDGWLLNGIGTPFTSNYIVSADTVFIAKWTIDDSSVTEHTVSFYEDGIQIPQYGITVPNGARIILPTPAKMGCTFDGWLKNNTGSLINGEYTVTEGVSFHARWTLARYTVAYYDEDGEKYSDIGEEVTYGGTITLPARTKAGHTFNGWLLDNSGLPIDGTYTVTDDVSFHAKFTVLKYMVTYYDENGQIYSDIGGEAAYGSTITLPPRTKIGHTFDGWLKNNTGTPIKGTYTVTEGVSFHAKFTLAHYTVSYYDENRQKYDDLGEEVTYGDTITLPTRTKTGYKFDGWRKNNTGALINGTYMVTDNVSFYAYFTINFYTVRFYDETGQQYDDLGYMGGYGNAHTLPTMEKTGYAFDGWLKNNEGTPIKGTYTVTDNVSFHAKFTLVHTVAYYDENGQIYSYIGGIVNDGDTITLPTRTKTGNRFDGWLKDNTGSPINGTYTVTEDVSFYAKWTAMISYYDENGRLYSDIGGEVTYGSIIALPIREKTDYTFDGWLENNTGSPINGTYTVTGNVSFYAKWTLTGATLITNATELYNIRSNLSGKYMLVNDISVAGFSWSLIGPFTGILEGNGFKITDLSSYEGSAGLFHSIGSGAEVRNLTVEVSAVRGTSYAGGLAGIIAGTADNMAVISNVHIRGTGVIQTDSSYNQATEQNTISVSAIAGGISGMLDNAILINCSNTVNVTSSSRRSSTPSLPPSFSSFGSCSGGIAGHIPAWSGAVMITNSYNTGDITSSSSLFVDYDSHSYNSTASSKAGGIIGCVSNGLSPVMITNSYNIGDITSSSPTPSVSSVHRIDSDSGGIIGSLSHSNITIMNSYNIGNIISSAPASRSSSYAGGLVGNGRGNITSCMAANSSIDATRGTTKYMGRIIAASYYGSGNNANNNFALNIMQAVGGSFDTTPANHGISKTESQLQTRSTYEDPVNGDGLGGLGWLFGNDDEHPWKMPEGGGYPILYWQE